MDNLFGRLNRMQFQNTFWRDIVYRNKFTCVLWTLFVFIVMYCYPTFGMYLACASIAVQVMYFTSQVTIETIEQVSAQVTNHVPIITQAIGDGMNKVRDIAAGGGVNWKSICANAQKHKAGIAANMTTAANSKSASDIICNIISIMSHLGMEQTLIETFVNKLYSIVASPFQEPRVPVAHLEALEDMFSNVSSMLTNSHNTSFSKKRLATLIGGICAGTGYKLSGINPLNFISEAAKSTASVEKLWDQIEEYLNAINLISTGKWAYMADLATDFEAIRDEFDYFNNLLATDGAKLCQPAVWRRWQSFREKVKTFDARVRSNTCPDLKSSNLIISVQTVISKVISWDSMIAQIRSTAGTRPVPIGICLQGKSQLGKTMLSQELYKRVQTKLYALYETDPITYAAFADARDWSLWSVQARDEFDESYTGQELVYADDAFADKTHKDHIKWLTFISNQAVGTVQARLDQKGSPFVARACMVSCNVVPTGSTTINNIEALHERFPFTVCVSLANGASVPKASDMYDPDFSHLRLKVAQMKWSCARTGGCSNHCSCVEVTLDSLVDGITTRMVQSELKYQSQIALMSHRTAEPPVLPVANMEVIEDGTPEPVRTTTFTNSTLNAHQLYWQVQRAYNVQCVDRVDHPYIVAIYSCLKHRTTGDLALRILQTEDIDNPSTAFLQLGRYEVIPGKQNFLNSFLTSHPILRIRDPELCVTWIWGPLVDQCTRMIAIPDTLDEFNNYWSRHGAELIRDHHARELMEADQLRENEDRQVFEVLNRRHDEALLAERQAVLDRRQRADTILVRSLPFSALIVSTLPGLGWGLSIFATANVAMHVTLLGNVVDDTAELAAAFAGVLASIRNNQDRRGRLWAPVRALCYVPEKICNALTACHSAWETISSWCAVARDKIIGAIISFFEWCGLSVPEVVSSLLRTVTDMTLHTIRLALLPIIGGVIYVVYKWLTKSEPTVELESFDKGKAVPKRSRIPVTLGRRSGKNLEFWFGASLPEKHNEGKKEHWNEKDCPFCDDDIVEADGEVIGLSDSHIAKPNKFRTDWATEDWVILNANHDPVDHLDLEYPLMNEMVVLEELAVELGIEHYVWEKNKGVLSPGSIAHPHVQLHGMETQNVTETKLVDEFTVLDVRSVRVHFKKMTQRGVAIEWVTPRDNPVHASCGIRKALKDVFGDNMPTHWFVNGETHGPLMYARLTALSSSPEGTVPVAYTRVEAALYCKGKRVLTGEIAEQGVSVTDAIGNIVNMQSSDDAALDVANSIVRDNLVWICRGESFTRTRQSAGDDFDCTNIFHCTALAFGDEIVFPAHIGNVGDLLKIRQLGQTPLGAQMPLCSGIKYIAARVLAVDIEYELGYAKFITPEEASVRLEELYCLGRPRLDNCLQPTLRWPMTLTKHLMTNHQLLALEKGVSVVQWLPKDGVRSISQAVFIRQQATVVNAPGKPSDNVIKTWWQITSLDSSSTQSRAGDCGGPVVAYNCRVNKKFLGFHVASGSGHMNAALLTLERLENLRGIAKAFAVISMESVEIELYSHRTPIPDVTPAGLGHTQMRHWPIVEWVNPEMDPFSKLLVDGNGRDLPLEVDAHFVGMLPQGITPANEARGISHWKHSPFFGAFRIAMEPAALDPQDPRITGEILRNRAGMPTLLQRPNRILAEVLPSPDLPLLEECGRQLLAERILVFTGREIGTGTDDQTETLNIGLNGRLGNAYYHGLETNASAGYPWNVTTKPSKSDYIDVDPILGTRSFKDDYHGRKLETLCRQKLAWANIGRRCTSFVTSKLKDSLVANRHVEAGKTRVFNGSAIESVIVGHALFSTFKDVYMQLRQELNHAIGINVHSYEWTVLYNRLSKYEQWIDLDYSNFDKHQLSVIMRLAFTNMIETIQAVSPDAYRMARYVLAEEDINSLMVDYSTVWMTEKGNKSGCALTTIINSEVNEINLFYAFSYIRYKKFGLAPSLAYYRANVELVTFGDDAVLSFSNEVKDWFNFPSLQKALLTFGQVITAADKLEGETLLWRNSDETTFLKRNFKVDGAVVICPLEKSSIEKSFGWTDVDSSRVDVWYQIVDDHLDEAMLHGPEYYNYFVDRLSVTMTKNRVNSVFRNTMSPILAMSYEARRQIYLQTKVFKQ